MPCQSDPAIRPATDRSSSSSSQCSEVPPPPISYFDLCSGVARRNNGNQIIGTLTSRPSVSETCIFSSSKLTDFARAVVGTKALPDLASVLAKVLIPSLKKKPLVILNQPTNLVHSEVENPKLEASPTGSSQNFASSSAALIGYAAALRVRC